MKIKLHFAEKALSLFIITRYSESNLPSTSPWEELGIWAGTTKLPILNQAKGQSLRFFWFKHQDGKVDPPHRPSPCHQPIPLQCTFYNATRLSLKTRWLRHSHGSSFCRFSNIFKIKLRYELCLFTLNFSFFHEHTMPFCSVSGMSGARPIHWCKAHSHTTCSGKASGALFRWDWVLPLLCAHRLRRAI